MFEEINMLPWFEHYTNRCIKTLHGILQILTIIMSIKSKIKLYFCSLMNTKKICTQSPFPRMLSVVEPVLSKFLCVFLVGSQVWGQLTSKKTNRHERVRHLEVERKWPSSLHHLKVPGIQAPLFMSLCCVCPDLPTLSQCLSHLD